MKQLIYLNKSGSTSSLVLPDDFVEYDGIRDYIGFDDIEVVPGTSFTIFNRTVIFNMISGIVLADNKIQAIKLAKIAFGLGLKEAKNFIEFNWDNFKNFDYS